MNRAILAVFLARILRNLCSGGSAVVFYILLSGQLESGEVAAIVAATLLGDFIVSMYVTTSLVRHTGRRAALGLATFLYSGAGVAFGLTDLAPVLGCVGAIGVLSPTGADMGPFLAIEQTILVDVVDVVAGDGGHGERCADAQKARADKLSGVVTWYQVAGSLASALGALGAGFLVHYLEDGQHESEASALRKVYLIQAAMGGLLLLLYAFLMPSSVESPPPVAPAAAVATSTEMTQRRDWRLLGLSDRRARSVVAGVSGLFILDAFAGGIVMQSFISWWFHVRWGVPTHWLGVLLLGVNVIGGTSGLPAKYFVKKFGAVNTMVFTHSPSSVLLALVAVMPSAASAAAMVLLRFTISQMDVPARQLYVASVVAPHDRTAAAGITTAVRSIGTAVSPVVVVLAMRSEDNLVRSSPFLIAAGLKLIYDACIFVLCRRQAAKDAKQLNTERTALLGGDPTTTTTTTSAAVDGVEPVHSPANSRDEQADSARVN
jgi:hypothetical protein